MHFFDEWDNLFFVGVLKGEICSSTSNEMGFKPTAWACLHSGSLYKCTVICFYYTKLHWPSYIFSHAWISSLCPQITLDLHEVTLLIIVFFHEVTNIHDNRNYSGGDLAPSWAAQELGYHVSDTMLNMIEASNIKPDNRWSSL